MHIEIDQDKCCGAGQCVMLAPAYFDQDDEGVAFTLQDTVEGDDVAQVRETIAACPTIAIQLV
ncbi:ferredoxin [Microtetraspora sp. NBRC 16547]|uniref:ferredoxin n=1 Tax=Microtetraspora sp. NBRC 16547 TaxID=3030993 RepID=UPI0024A2B94B|nr:ferredoxin [Microtetraspora sp. NBRC 16547]GLW99358.1 ferredoxin [Microtetraspora sp. NBRC 16547]